MGSAGVVLAKGRVDRQLESVRNGYEATMAIRKLPDEKKASIPIVAMTANAFEEDKQNAISAGMNGHIAKPIDVPKLLNTLAGILN